MISAWWLLGLVVVVPASMYLGAWILHRIEVNQLADYWFLR